MKLFIAFVVVTISLFSAAVPGYSHENQAEGSGSHNILMKNHQHIAIATDLEPDDVLALLIIFKEANRQYEETGKYPIDLVIVGEGNVEIKKKRMEALLNFMKLPEGITIDIVKGKSTSDNIFPLDGQELFHEQELTEIPFLEHSEDEGAESITHFLSNSYNPLIIQLKPAQELLSVPLELTKNATIMFYGSFNFRKTVEDEIFLKSENFSHLSSSSEVEKLQELLNHFEKHFKRVGILESYGILGEESAVYSGYPWTDGIREQIENSNDDFMMMFKKLVHNWNSYILQAELKLASQYLHEIIVMLPIAEQSALQNLSLKLNQINEEWNESLFTELYNESKNELQLISDEHLEADLKNIISRFEGTIKFINQLKPSNGVQFTLSDVGVALALSDKLDIFQASPVKIKVNERKFIEVSADFDSNVQYYNRIKNDKFAQILLDALSF